MNDAPLEPSPYSLAASIRGSLSMIREYYDEALIPPKMTSGVRLPTAAVPADQIKMKPAKKAFEHPPAPVSFAVLDARAAAHSDLAHYARVILNEVRSVDGRTIQTRVDGSDVEGLTYFLETWALRMAEEVPDEAVACKADMETHANALHAFAIPIRRNWIKLGNCPFVIEGVFCHGQVRGYGEEGQATCTDCQQYGPTEWWEEVIVGSVGELQTYEEILTFIHKSFGRVIKRPTLRTWLARGVLSSAGPDALGRTVYTREAVVWAMTRAA